MRPRRIRAHAGGQDGFALLAVLWATMMLAIIVASLMTSGRTETLIARNRSRAAVAEATADAAINGAILRMLDADPTAQPPTDGRVWRTEFNGIPVRVSVQDEAGKIDLNHADAALLTGLLEVGGLPARDARATAARVQDWRRPRVPLRATPVGDAAFGDSGDDYGPRHGPFRTVAELLLVPGMDPLVFDRVADALTVVSGTPWVDPSYAGRDALLAVPDMTAVSVDRTLAARAASAPPGVAQGHAFTIAAAVDDAGVHVERQALIRLTGYAQTPIWIYSWERGTRP
jgi:general secretion pathway protein K